MAVRIAPAHGSIVEVTCEAVRYTDSDGNPGTVELQPLHPEAPKYVGYHDPKTVPCSVRLGDTRFEFETTKLAYEELVDPLLRLDRLTSKEPKFVVPADSWWNVPIWIAAISALVLLAVLTDQWWAKWFAVATLLRAAYDGVFHLREKWDSKSSVR